MRDPIIPTSKPRITFGRSNSGEFWQVMFPQMPWKDASELVWRLGEIRGIPAYVTRGYVANHSEAWRAPFVRMRTLPTAMAAIALAQPQL